MKRFEGNCCNFERNSLTDGRDEKPMSVFESRSDMIMTPNKRDDDTGQSILNFLKAMKRNCRKIVIEGVAVIKFRGYKRICKDNGRGAIREERTWRSCQ